MTNFFLLMHVIYKTVFISKYFTLRPKVQYIGKKNYVTKSEAESKSSLNLDLNTAIA